MKSIEYPLVYIVDDELETLNLYKSWCEKAGFVVEVFQDPQKFSEIYVKEPTQAPHIILSDMMMPAMSGIELFGKLKVAYPNVIFICITGSRDVNMAVEAMKSGAFDYISKSIGYEEFLVRIQKAFGIFRLQNQNNMMEKDVFESNSYFGVWGTSPAIRRVYDSLKRYSGVESPVFLHGEKGSGLEDVGRAFHGSSSRNDQTFTSMNAALSSVEDLRASVGESKGGSLFISNIEQLSADGQVWLSQYLTRTPTEVRFIVGSHMDLLKAKDDGSFLSTLYFQLTVYPVKLPPLRERCEDISTIAQIFISKYSQMWGRPATRLSENALKVLMNYSWPGNCIELDRTIERAVILSEEHEVPPECIQFDVSGEDSPFEWLKKVQSLPTLKEFELEFIKEALKRSDGRKERAAKILGIGRKTLYRKELELRARSEDNNGSK